MTICPDMYSRCNGVFVFAFLFVFVSPVGQTCTVSVMGSLTLYLCLSFFFSPVGQTCTVGVVRTEWSWGSWRSIAQVYTFVRRLKNTWNPFRFSNKFSCTLVYLLLEEVHSSSQGPDVFRKLCQGFPEKDIAMIARIIDSSIGQSLIVVDNPYLKSLFSASIDVSFSFNTLLSIFSGTL